jgi:hypothetical protein
MAPVGARNTAFTGELLHLLRDGVPGGPAELHAGLVFGELVRRLQAAGMPVPRQANTNAGVSLSIARNAAFGTDEAPPPAPADLAAASRWLAEAVSVSVQWPDQEVVVVDRVPEMSYWVVYLSNSGERPVHDVVVTLAPNTPLEMALGFPPVEPSRRRWYILREDTPFPVSGPMPHAVIEFTALGIRWRSDRGQVTAARSSWDRARRKRGRGRVERDDDEAAVSEVDVRPTRPRRSPRA